MENPIGLNRLSENNVFRRGDVFVLFGELFGRGYATGLLDEARRAGMMTTKGDNGGTDDTAYSALSCRVRASSAHMMGMPSRIG